MHFNPFDLFGVLRVILIVLEDSHEQRSPKFDLAGQLIKHSKILLFPRKKSHFITSSSVGFLRLT